MCDACRIYMIDPIPEGPEIAYYYRKNYSKIRFDLPVVSPVACMKLFYADMRAKSQYRYIDSVISLRRGAKVVELGCSTGNLLYLFKKNGCDAVGVELGESSSGYATNRYGLTVLKMDIGQALDRVGDNVDLIVISHTLEHLPNPKEILLKCGWLLQKHGALFIELPNSYIGPPEGDRWEEFASILLDSDHMFNFSPLNLETLLRCCRLEVKKKTCFLSQKRAPILKRLGLETKVDHLYTRRRTTLGTYAPLFLNTLYLAKESVQKRDTIELLTGDTSWSGTDEWMRFIAVPK